MARSSLCPWMFVPSIIGWIERVVICFDVDESVSIPNRKGMQLCRIDLCPNVVEMTTSIGVESINYGAAQWVSMVMAPE